MKTNKQLMEPNQGRVFVETVFFKELNKELARLGNQYIDLMLRSETESPGKNNNGNTFTYYGKILIIETSELINQSGNTIMANEMYLKQLANNFARVFAFVLVAYRLFEKSPDPHDKIEIMNCIRVAKNNTESKISEHLKVECNEK